MIATVLDTATGKRVVKEGIRSFEWADNNWSCDCNRMGLFNVEDDTNTCVGGKRFLVVGAEFEVDEPRYSLRELNADYPEVLLKEHLSGEA